MSHCLTQCHDGLALLLRAYRYAESVEGDPWNFAVDVLTLKEAGLATLDLRWLVLAGYALHAEELTHATDRVRRFGPHGLASITPQCAVLLTCNGARLIEDILAQEIKAIGTDRGVGALTVTGVTSDQSLAVTLPYWDQNRRELTLGGIVVKRFLVPAPNQELLLAAFQELHWPDYIDDPLVPVKGQNSKERLKAAIRCLNRNRLAKLIRFRGNGNGMRIHWERVP